ncbi:hypothetical protein Rsub_04200 [Raphidocelis subcapitata]|uniref:Uncharacterized protein n=1 Tax=Raphidocelis subcapitata TaxID=307507 RepID=A0A2V0P0V2_9CHLO|nr:hypothetical protein Rsub_04200 [Raphidocelis subcapitata]|eukprot:GBF91460.1 hypothetical protein Rsub_04200 [Raphidocelis subcapitata]
MFVFEGASVHDLVQPIQRLLGNGPPWGLSLSFGFGGGAGPGDELAGAPGAALRSSSPAARQLRQALQSAQRTDGAAFWKAQLLSTAGTLVQLDWLRGQMAAEVDRLLRRLARREALLTRALYPNQPTAATVASLIATPFRPFFISSLHTMALELSFLQRALQEPSIRPAQRLHSAAGLAGVALFAVEDSVPHIPLVHCAWHLCSALATNSVHALLRDVEERADGGGALKPAGAGAGPGPPAPRGAGAAVAAVAAAAAAAAVGREFEVLPLQLAP